MTYTVPVVADDGKWYQYNGYDAAGRVVREAVDPPTEELPAVTPIAVPLKPVNTGLFKREEVHGEWYQSIWFWSWIFVTLCLAGWWVGSMYSDESCYTHFVTKATGYVETCHSASENSVLLVWFGWVYWAWMPIGVGLIGAFQSAGYKRFAAAYSVVITALIYAYFASSKARVPQ